MEDSGMILSHISSLKEMLDQITQEIESSIVKCKEIGADLAVRKAELINTSGVLQFDIVGYVTVTDSDQSSDREMRPLIELWPLLVLKFLENVNYYAKSWLPARSIVMECHAAMEAIDSSGEIIKLN